MPVEAPKKPARSTKGGPATDLAIQAVTRHSNTERSPSSELVPFNFAVPAEFKKAYKLAAAELDMSMVDVLKDSFELFRRQHGLK